MDKGCLRGRLFESVAWRQSVHFGFLPKKLKRILILVFGSVIPLSAQENYDPFSETNIQGKGTKGVESKVAGKIMPKQIAITGGTIDWDDVRVSELMKAVSAFYRDNVRVPISKVEFIKFSTSRGYSIGSPDEFSAIKFVDGSFNYSARYADGRITLSHILLSEFTKAEEVEGEELASGLKLEGEDTPHAESKKGL